MSAVLSEKPVMRRSVLLSEVVEFNPKPLRNSIADELEVSFVPMAAVEAGSGRMQASQIRRFSEVKKGFTHFRDGDVLFAKITPCMENGKMAVANGLHNGIGYGSTEFHVLRPSEGLDARYLYYFVSSRAFRREAAHHMTGAVGLRRVPISFLEQCELAIPSVDEQCFVVAEIEKQFSLLDEAVASLHRVKANIARFVSSFLAHAVSGRLDTNEAGDTSSENGNAQSADELLKDLLVLRRSGHKGRGKYQEPANVSDRIGNIPNGWSWSTVDELALVGTGATPSRSKASYFDGGTVPWVTSTVVNAPYVDKAIECVTEAALAETNLTLYPPGTLLVAMYGEGKTRGKCSELRISATTNQALAALQVDERIRPYLKIFLQHNYEETRKAASGGVQPNLNLSLIRNIKVPLPPLAEQRRIVAEVDRRLSIARGVEAQVEANLKRTQALRQAVLTKAFGAAG